MNKIKKTMMAAAILIGTCVAPVAAFQSFGQELTDANGNAVSDNAAKSQSSGGGFYDIVFGSGLVGTLLWFALFGDGALAIYFSIDSSILIKPDKLMPKKLMDGVQAAMAEGDVVKAMEVCQQNPSAMSSIVMRPRPVSISAWNSTCSSTSPSSSRSMAASSQSSASQAS